MAFSDLFTGSGQARAQKTSRGLYGQAYDDNLDTLRAGVASARNDFTTGTNSAIDTLTGARDTATGIHRGGEGDALGFLDQGVTGAQGALGQARGAYQGAGSAFDRLAGLSDQFGAGTNTYLDALGLNGAEGLARARGAFDNTLRTDFEMDQGLEAINRARAARGGGEVVGGNIDRDTQIFGQNLANSKTDSYLDRLLGLTDRQLGAEGAAASGRADAANRIGATYGQEAGYLNNAGLNRAQVAQSTADRIAALTSGTGTQVAGLQQGLGTQLGNTGLNATNQQISLRDLLGTRYAGSFQDEATARDQGSANTLATGLKLAELAASLGGGAVGGGGLNFAAQTGSLY